MNPFATLPVYFTEHALPGVFLVAKDRPTVDVLLAAENRLARVERERDQLLAVAKEIADAKIDLLDSERRIRLYAAIHAATGGEW